MKISRFVLAQCAVWGISLAAGDPPPLPSYNFGITGEPTKVDTAFGNLGERGPVYHVPEAIKESTTTTGKNPQLGNTDEPIRLTKPHKIVKFTTPTGKFNSSHNVEDTTIVQPDSSHNLEDTTTAKTISSRINVETTTTAKTNSSSSVETTTTAKTNSSRNVEETMTAETTDREIITLPGTESVLNGTAYETGPLESSTVPNSSKFETTTVSKEEPTSRGNNITSNSSNTSITAEATDSSTDSSDSSNSTSSYSEPSTTSSFSESTTQSASFSNPSKGPSTEGSERPTATEGQPSQTVHAGSPNSTETSTTIPNNPGHNETKPGQNSTLPSKPNSSLSLYHSSEHFWLASAVISFYTLNRIT